jgi:tetratricopeptide (TPR) repeat protein
LLLLGLVAATWHRCLAFYDAETLWRDTLEKNDTAWIAHNNLGKILLDRGELVPAIDHFKRVVELKPDHYNAWNNLGLAYTGLEQYAVAESALDQARRLRPGDETILVNYATLLVRQERFDEAGDIYRQVINYYPASVPAHMNLGNMLAGLQKYDAAERVYAKARELQPDNPVLLYNLGNLARDREDLTLALEYYQGAVAVAPDYVDALNNIEVLRSRQAIAAAQLNMAESLAAQGRYAEAAARYRQVLGLDAGSVPAQGRLAWILATAPDENVRRPKEAVALASAAVSATAGEVPEMLDTLAAAQAAAGNFREALEQIGVAIELAEAQGRDDLLAVLQQRRNLYEQSRPYLESKH